MNKLAAMALLFLLGTNAFSMPLVFVESDIYAVEIEVQPAADTAQTEDSSSMECEERQEESAILIHYHQHPIENRALHFSNHNDKTLIGALPDFLIPPNI